MALLLLASGDLLPRQRARDQQADISGSALKARILNELVLLDPEPVQMERRWSRSLRCSVNLLAQRGRLLSAYSKSGKQPARRRSS